MEKKKILATSKNLTRICRKKQKRKKTSQHLKYISSKADLWTNIKSCVGAAGALDPYSDFALQGYCKQVTER